MKFKALFTFLSYFLVLFCVWPHYATAQNCDVIGETLVTLKRPLFNTPTVWNSFYGADGLDQITDIALGEEGTFVIIGHYTNGLEDQTLKPFIAKIDGRGRTIWEKRLPVKLEQTMKSILKTEKGYIVLGEQMSAQKTRGLFLARYSNSGELLEKTPLYEKGYNLESHDFASSKSGKSFIVAATRHERRAQNPQQEAVLYKITPDGKRLWRRQYSPGLSSAFFNIEKAPDDHYTLTGSVEQANGRMAGWVQRIDDNGALLWQKSYPRGLGAQFLSSHTLEDQSIIVSGGVEGAGVDRAGAVLMKIDLEGNALWERYYQGYADYKAADLLGYEDGRIVALLNGSVDQSDNASERGHISLLTFNPRGRLMDVESFTDGQSGQADTVHFGHYQERLIAGFVQKKNAIQEENSELESQSNEQEEAEERPLHDGWVFAVPALDPYTDTCS